MVASRMVTRVPLADQCARQVAAPAGFRQELIEVVPRDAPRQVGEAAANALSPALATRSLGREQRAVVTRIARRSVPIGLAHFADVEQHALVGDDAQLVTL